MYLSRTRSSRSHNLKLYLKNNFVIRDYILPVRTQLVTRVQHERRILSEACYKLSYLLAGYTPVQKREFIEDLRLAIEQGRGYAAGKIGRTAQYMARYEILLAKSTTEAKIKQFESGLEFQCLKQQGIFPVNNDFYRRYSRFYIDEIHNLDCLGICYYPGELEILKHYKITNNIIYYPYQEPDRSLPENEPNCYLPFFRGKKLLIICPFAGLLRERASKDIFEGVWAKTGKKWFYPKSVDAVEFPYGFSSETHKRHATVFDLFEEIKGHIRTRDFDIALIGAAGLAIPIASFVKSLGKVAIDLGGHLQIVFGVLGQRWRNWGDWKRDYFTEYWIDMPAGYKPKDTDVCDSGAYW